MVLFFRPLCARAKITFVEARARVFIFSAILTGGEAEQEGGVRRGTYAGRVGFEGRRRVV